MTDVFDVLQPDKLNRAFFWRLKHDAEGNHEAAVAFIKGFRFSIFIDPEDAGNPVHQICLLTIVNAARRISGQPGSVRVFGAENRMRNDLSGLGGSLKGAVEEIGGVCGGRQESTDTLGIVIGDATATFDCQFVIRAVFNGWRGGIVPYDPSERFGCSGSGIPLGAILAAGLSVYECFRYRNGEGSAIGYRAAGMSLWDIGREDWLSHDDTEPRTIVSMPPLWFCGLGHLGQAYIWTLGHLPISVDDKTGMEIMIQDKDKAGEANLSTSLLVNEDNINVAKTAICKEWLRRRGFGKITAMESLLTPDAEIDFGDASVICGFDNFKARRQAAHRKPPLLIDGGIGARTESFQCIEVTAFPSHIDPQKRWHENGRHKGESSQFTDRLYKAGKIDQCGLTKMENTAVGFPFVGVATSAIVIAELLRRHAGGTGHASISMDMSDVENRTSR